VTLNGISEDPKTNNLILVMEYMKHGSLYDLLFKQNVKMARPEIIQIALDSAKGLSYLHSQNPVVIHRDFKSENVLVSSNVQCLFCHFLKTIASFTVARNEPRLLTSERPNFYFRVSKLRLSLVPPVYPCLPRWWRKKNTMKKLTYSCRLLLIVRFSN
jgi:serine/threonine protein kinase